MEFNTYQQISIRDKAAKADEDNRRNTGWRRASWKRRIKRFTMATWRLLHLMNMCGVITIN